MKRQGKGKGKSLEDLAPHSGSTTGTGRHKQQ